MEYENLEVDQDMGGVNFASFLGIRKYRISLLSIVYSDEIAISDGVKVGAFNFIRLTSVKLGKGSRIGHFNLFAGKFGFDMGNGCIIGNFNKFTCSSKAYYHPVYLKMEDKSHVVSNHIFDMTDCIRIGKGSVVAGAGTQFWTHSFYITKDEKYLRVDSPINIGCRCYIGARCCILGGVTICDDVTVGAMTCVSKSLDKCGVYVGGGLRYFEKEYDFDKKFGEPSCGNNIYRILK